MGALYWLLYDPWVMLAAVVLAVWLLQGTFRGRYWSPFGWFRRRSQIRQLKNQLVANPHDLTAHLDAGKLLVESGRHKEALPHLDQVVERRDASPEGWYFLGRARLGTNDLDGGRAAIETALGLRANLLQGDPWLHLGNWYYKQKRWSDALPCFEQLVAHNASTSEGFHKLGVCHREVGQSAEARAAFDEAVHAHESVPKYKRRENRPWKWRAMVARKRL
ncbi:MAG: tetratricopeptide repeat protein [Proteobacteria bacterium]|nr:tetratricopeptide repeat protein [Pseudomonadota bacterium]MCP4919969.1 tetratricopeptide repeat protein [Pseudomonadota bacterium]